MLGEVDEVTTVQGEQADPHLNAARSNPRVVLRPRPTTKVRTSCEPTPRHCDGVVPWHDGLPEYPTINSVRSCGPQLRTSAHFDNSPTVTNVNPHAVAN